MPAFSNMNYTYSKGVAPAIRKFYERNALRNVSPELIHARDAQKRTLDEHNGKSVTFHRYTPFPAITEPLAEGITPNGQTLEMTEFSVMVKPYGGFVALTDEMQWALIDNMHLQTSQLLSDQAALSLDTISRNALHTGTNVQYVGENTSRGTITPDDKLDYLEIKKAVRTLRRRNCKPFADGFYHGIVHPDVTFDLTSDKTHWIDVATYQDKQKIEKYELGCAYKVKFFESTNAMVFKPQSVIVGTTAEIVASAFDATRRVMTTATKFTADDARALTGLLVNVQYTSGGKAYTTPMCIEAVDYEKSEILLRWLPADTSAWTTANQLKLVPYGGGAAGCDVYSTLIYGQDSHGTVSLGSGGDNFRVIINPPGSAGAEDPLEQRGTVAWKVKGFCTAILQDDFIVRVESGASA